MVAMATSLNFTGEVQPSVRSLVSWGDYVLQPTDVFRRTFRDRRRSSEGEDPSHGRTRRDPTDRDFV